MIVNLFKCGSGRGEPLKGVEAEEWQAWICILETSLPCGGRFVGVSRETHARVWAEDGHLMPVRLGAVQSHRGLRVSLAGLQMWGPRDQVLHKRQIHA